MKIRSIGIGPHRWYIEMLPADEKEANEFYHWMKENFPNCFLKLRSANSHGRYFWEVRGSDKEEHAAIMLSWM